MPINNNLFTNRVRFIRKIQFSIFSISLSLSFLFAAAPAMATEYYVDSQSGNDSNSGTSADNPFRTIQKIAALNLGPGDSVYLKRGSSWEEELSIDDSGASQSPLSVGAYGSGSLPELRSIRIQGNYVTVADLNVDRNKESADAIIVTGDNCTLQGLVVQNGTKDGIDIRNVNNILIEDCHIHHFLNGSFSNQADAHGIVATGTQGITIRNTEIHQVSGDSFQADPNRDPNDISNDILIEDCHFWTGPLDEDFNSGWVKTSHLPDDQKQYPGENAIDTKVVKDGWDNVPRMQLVIKNSTFHGWIQDGYISNKAALNLKEKIEAVIDGCTVYDSEIGFRLRGGSGNANVTIKNTHIYNCEYALRTEDNLENLIMYNSIFGVDIGEKLRTVSSSYGFDTWTIINNQFLDSKPSIASDPSNQVISYAEYLTLIGSTRPAAPINLRIKTSDTGISPDPDPTPIEPGDHSHFDTEKNKPGVILYRAYRTDEEISRDWVSMDGIPYGAQGSAYYDSNLDGAVIPIIEGIDEANSLRASFPQVTTELWAQWEMYIDQDFIDDLPITSDDGAYWVNTKLFRFYNNAKLGCSNKNHDTLFVGWSDWNDRKNFDWQDTDDADCGGEVVDLGDANTRGDQWLRWTYYINFQTDRIATWITTMSGQTTKLADVVRSSLLAGGMDGIGPLLHSTSRDHHPDTNHPTYIFAYRNMIVSTEQIGFY